MWIIAQQAALGVSKAARHPEVNQESAPGLEPNDQILSAPVDEPHAFPLELCCDGRRLERAGQPRVEDVLPFERPADERRLELDANRLDLRQLGHVASVTARVRRSSRARSDGDPARHARWCTRRGL